MIATATSFPTAVVYLVLVVLQFAGGGSPRTFDYVQDGVPAFRIEVSSAQGIYRLSVTPIGEKVPFVIRAERSMLVSHNYLVYSPDAGVPVVVSTGNALAALASAGEAPVTMVSLPAEAEGADAGAGSALYLLRRPGTTIVSAPDSGIILVTEGR